MTIKQISELLEAKVLCGADRLDEENDIVFASDLMSEVLTIGDHNPIL